MCAISWSLFFVQDVVCHGLISISTFVISILIIVYGASGIYCLLLIYCIYSISSTSVLPGRRSSASKRSNHLYSQPSSSFLYEFSIRSSIIPILSLSLSLLPFILPFITGFSNPSLTARPLSCHSLIIPILDSLLVSYPPLPAPVIVLSHNMTYPVFFFFYYFFHQTFQDINL